MSFDDVKQLVIDANMGFVATEEGDQPRVRAMMPVLLDDGRLLAATFPKTPKVAQIAKDPKVEVCFVDRTLSHCRFEGTAAIIDDKALKEELWNKQPMLMRFFRGLDDPNYTLIVITPSKIRMMRVGDPGYVNIAIPSA